MAAVHIGGNATYGGIKWAGTVTAGPYSVPAGTRLVRTFGSFVFGGYGNGASLGAVMKNITWKLVVTLTIGGTPRTIYTTRGLVDELLATFSQGPTAGEEASVLWRSPQWPGNSWESPCSWGGAGTSGLTVAAGLTLSGPPGVPVTVDVNEDVQFGGICV